MSSGGYVLLVAVLAALAFGVYRAMVDGRFRGTHRIRGAVEAEREMSADVTSVLAGTPWSEQLGERATFLQFSSAFCAPCRATRRILEDVVAETPGVAHVEVDAEHHLELVRRLGVLRTPTTLVLDGAGVEVTRAAGAPTKAQVQAAIAALTG
ncbi:TlpA family protein disulfide reductase [Nocardioides pocheonensis]|jgi:thiol-disulfide isomerase/thioredoxin|uniref:Thioredoxin n=1 Tax=Nocardioides pocheonensis TaxID=661485 RepID=A0A3N0GRV7_9ACTN|nr:thioredoxin family protein [Nocardioides pocheonensis]RNM14810.1 thioredoxin [Nocardioides pocheonensis]